MRAAITLTMLLMTATSAPASASGYVEISDGDWCEALVGAVSDELVTEGRLDPVDQQIMNLSCRIMLQEFAIFAAAEDRAGSVPESMLAAISFGPAPTDAPVGAVPALDFGSGAGWITLFDQTFPFGIMPGAGLCRDVFGIIQAGGNYTDVDGTEISSEFYIPPLDWASYEDGRYDPPSVYLEIDSGEHAGRWTADAAGEFDVEGTSQIEDYQKEGLTASGTGTFRNEWDSGADPVRGSFAISCVGE